MTTGSIPASSPWVPPSSMNHIHKTLKVHGQHKILWNQSFLYHPPSPNVSQMLKRLQPMGGRLSLRKRLPHFIKPSTPALLPMKPKLSALHETTTKSQSIFAAFWIEPVITCQSASHHCIMHWFIKKAKKWMTVNSLYHEYNISLTFKPQI